MGRRPLLLSALAFLVLLGVTVWLVRDEEAPAPQPFFSLQRGTPDTLTVAFLEDTTVIVPGGRTGWQLIRPVRYPADGVAVAALLKRLENLEVARTLPFSPQKLDEYGLRFPRAVVRAAYRNLPRADTLVVGGFSLNTAWDYARPGTREAVALLDHRITSAFVFKTSHDWRDTRLLPFHESRALSLKLGGPDGAVTVELEKREDGGWWVKTPYPGPASLKKTREYLAALSHMHIARFVREGEGPLAPYGLHRPRVQAVVRTADRLLRLDLGDAIPGEDEQVFAVTSGQPHVLGVSDRYRRVLSRGADGFREPAPFPFGLMAVDSVRIVSGETGITVSLGDPLSGPEDLRKLLGGWIVIRAEAFEWFDLAAPAARALAPPVGRLFWWGRGGIRWPWSTWAAGGGHGGPSGWPEADTGGPERSSLCPRTSWDRSGGPLGLFWTGERAVERWGTRLVAFFVSVGPRSRFLERKPEPPMRKLQPDARGLIAVITVLILGTSAIPALAETRVGGHLTKDETWTKAGNPYVVVRDVVIPEGITLTLEPGVDIRFKKDIADREGTNAFDLELLVRGTLMAHGSERDTITLTSDDEDPRWMDWQGIVIEGENAKADLKAVHVEFAITGINCIDGTLVAEDLTVRWSRNHGVRLVRGTGKLKRFLGTRIGNIGGTGVGVDVGATSQVTIEDSYFVGVQNGINFHGGGTGTVEGSIISMCTGHGIRIRNTTALIRNCTITENEYGLSTSHGSAPEVRNNNIFDNGTADLWLTRYGKTPVQVDFSGNWWGGTNLSRIDERILDAVDNPGDNGFAVIEPILPEAVAAKQ